MDSMKSKRRQCRITDEAIPLGTPRNKASAEHSIACDESSPDHRKYVVVGGSAGHERLLVGRRKGAIQELLKRHSTPVFVADKDVLIERFAALQAALDAHWPKHVIAYSFKTNYLVAESRVFQEQGAWAEVVSGWEYQLAKTLGFAGDRIIFNGPWKTDGELRQALEDGALLHVNDQDELSRLVDLTTSSRKMHPIGLRVSTTLPGFGHSRFGFSMDSDEATVAISTIREAENLCLAGLHAHLHGDTDDPACYRLACRKMVALLAERVPDFRSTIQYLDLGGGFPANTPKPFSRETWKPRPIDEYIAAIVGELVDAFPGKRRPTLIVEPGRYLVNDGIDFLSRVVSVRDSEATQVITSNGSLSMIPLTHYRPQIISALSSDFVECSGSQKRTIIHGASCRENDILFEGMFPAVEVGDYLVHRGVGAYNSSLGPDFIFESPPLFFI